ncbi:MAG: YdeI/OmpD-associated family protein [Myxococcota bacterium]
MGTQDPKVDAFVSRAKTWRGEIQKIRSILLECGLDEELKWGKPCFTFEGKNIAIIQPFKEHCSLMFFKGALLKDTHGLLRSQGENTQSALRLEFTSEAQIKKTMLKSYVTQAVAVEQAGLNVDFKAKRELELPEELTSTLRKDRKLAKAFKALTPGRQRSYVLYITAGKQAKTRMARVEKSIPGILAGVGMNEH